MKSKNSIQKIYFTLRLGVAMCFIGHGAFGIITKPIWCNYFGVFGIGHDMAYHLMPVIGLVDILFGVSILIFPTRIVVLWLFVWGLATASLRPFSGESFAEFIERAGNFGVAAALIILCGGFYKTVHFPLEKIRPPGKMNFESCRYFFSCIRVTVFLLLLGHGWLNIIEKTGLIHQYQSLGLSRPALAAYYIGTFEILGAIVVLIYPLRSFVLLMIIWKMGTELFYPQHAFFEWIERGASYAALISLWHCLEWKSFQTSKKMLVSQHLRFPSDSEPAN
jgi:uncharacterized membrane protein YphA (DoxX/SURF4 family)